ncbi:hypothetical protein Tco_0597827 [Tanacetum coccineum]
MTSSSSTIETKRLLVSFVGDTRCSSGSFTIQNGCVPDWATLQPIGTVSFRKDEHKLRAASKRVWFRLSDNAVLLWRQRANSSIEGSLSLYDKLFNRMRSFGCDALLLLKLTRWTQMVLCHISAWVDLVQDHFEPIRSKSRNSDDSTDDAIAMTLLKRLLKASKLVKATSYHSVRWEQVVNTEPLSRFHHRRSCGCDMNAIRNATSKPPSQNCPTRIGCA